MSSPRRPTTSRRFAAASARRTGCARATASSRRASNSVTIGSVEKFITDTAWNQGWVQPIKPRRERPESVGIVGAGPAGLAAAEQLRRKGYQVTVYDRYDRVGGLLIYGIPNFKLEKDIVQRRETLLRDSKVTFELNCEVGRDVTMDELRARHAAVLIATGVYKARDIAAPGVGVARHRGGARLSHGVQPQRPRRQGGRVRLGRARTPRARTSW